MTIDVQFSMQRKYWVVGAYGCGAPAAGSARRHPSLHSIVYVSGDSMECVTSKAGVRFPQLAHAVAAPACNIALPRIVSHSSVINNHSKQHITHKHNYVLFAE